MAYKQKEKGFIGAGMLMFAILALTLVTFSFQWLTVETRKEKARNYQKMAESHVSILRSLGDYFFVDCMDDGQVASVSVQDLMDLGFLNAALMHNPYNFTYGLSIDRAATSFDPITGRAQAEGSSVMVLTVSDSAEHKDHLALAYRDKEIDFSQSNDDLIVRMDVNVTDEQLEQYYLLGGMQQDGTGQTYICR